MVERAIDRLARSSNNAKVQSTPLSVHLRASAKLAAAAALCALYLFPSVSRALYPGLGSAFVCQFH